MSHPASKTAYATAGRSGYSPPTRCQSPLRRGGSSETGEEAPQRMRGVTDVLSDEPRDASTYTGDTMQRARTVFSDPERDALRARDDERLQGILSFLETYGIPRGVAEPYVIKRFGLHV